MRLAYLQILAGLAIACCFRQLLHVSLSVLLFILAHKTFTISPHVLHSWAGLSAWVLFSQCSLRRHWPAGNLIAVLMFIDMSVIIEVYEYNSSAWAIVGGSIITSVLWGFVVVLDLLYNASNINLATRLWECSTIGVVHSTETPMVWPPESFDPVCHLTRDSIHDKNFLILYLVWQGVELSVRVQLLRDEG